MNRYLACIACCLLAGCQQDMARQPRYRPLQQSDSFDDLRSARPLVADTVARNHLHDDAHRYTGKRGDDYVETFPYPITPEKLERGQARFNIFCIVCHDRLGTGNGRIVQRGYTRPPSYAVDLSRGYKLKGKDVLLRDAPVGYYFDVITNGMGAMPDYAEQVPVDDRWAIIAYIRTLQLSQHAPLKDLPADEQERIRSRLGEQP